MLIKTLLQCADMPKKVKRKRGRPRKTPQPDTTSTSTRVTTATLASSADASATVCVTKKKRGRPRKQPIVEDDGWNPAEPFIRELHLTPRPKRYKAKKVPAHRHKFCFPKPAPDLNNPQEVVMRLGQLYIPDTLVRNVLQCTLEYIDAKHIPASKRYKICEADIYHFFAMIYYMGYCRLPAITDYWRVGDDITGEHPLCLT